MVPEWRQLLSARNPQDGVDAWTVYRNLWTTLANRYKNEPALFSYNLAVEFYLPGGNWRAENPSPLDYQFKDLWGLPNWHSWLLAERGSLAAINTAWGTSYATIDAIPQPEIVWAGNPGYTKPQAMIADYNSFKEWVAYRFLKSQAEAIRAVDGDHMITAGLHPHHPAIGWAGSAQYLATAAPDELDFLDYTTLHVYTSNADANSVHGAILAARFAHHPGKPVIARRDRSPRIRHAGFPGWSHRTCQRPGGARLGIPALGTGTNHYRFGADHYRLGTARL